MLLSVWEAMGSPIRALDELYVTFGEGMADKIVMFLWMLSTERQAWL